MKKIILSLVCLVTFTYCSLEANNHQIGSKNEIHKIKDLLFKIDHRFKNEYSENVFSLFKNALGVVIEENEKDFQELAQYLTNTLVKVQEIVFKIAEENEQMINDGTLIIPNTNFDKEKLHQLMLIYLGYVNPSHPDFTKHAHILYEYNQKDSILSDIEDDYEFDVADEVADLLDSQKFQNTLELLRDSEDPVYQEVYQEFKWFNCMENLFDEKIYKSDYLESIIDEEIEPNSELENQLFQIMNEMEDKVDLFIKKLENFKP